MTDSYAKELVVLHVPWGLPGTNKSGVKVLVSSDFVIGEFRKRLVSYICTPGECGMFLQVLTFKMGYHLGSPTPFPRASWNQMIR